MSDSQLILPISRIKIIMKSSPDVEGIKQDSLVMVTRLTELFIADLAKRAFSECQAYSLDYQHLAKVVQADNKLDFLHQILPCKITVKQFKEILAKKINKPESDSEESEVDEEDIKIVINDSP